MERKTQDMSCSNYFKTKTKNQTKPKTKTKTTQEEEQGQDQDQDQDLDTKIKTNVRGYYFFQHLSTSMLSLKLTSWLIPCTLR